MGAIPITSFNYMFLFAPLLQFELIEKAPSCDFDFFFPFIGLNEFDNTIV